MVSEARTLLGFDYGRKRIGVALGQELTASASPLCILRARDGKPDWEELAQLIRTWSPDALVIGIPVHMDGTEQAVTHEAKRLARQFEGRFGLPVYCVDERLSSEIAELRAREQQRRPGAIDAEAAQLILQDWLDQQVRGESRSD